MQYGQGKDLNANLRRARGYGSGWENVGQFIGGAINAGFGASNGNKDQAMKGLNQIGSSVNSFVNKASVNKQMSSGGLNLTTPANQTLPAQSGNQPAQPVNGQAQQGTTGEMSAAGQMASNSIDLGAGYNPKSNSFRTGSGQIISDPKQSFEQQATNALQQNNTFMASKGKKLNYLSFFN